ncbi:Maf family protein [Paenibacillus sp. 481]|uniref:Maf family protein n=1 Tax=Paenibacillus sp. 481 TaxID=2835869 RepID=UPI001E284F02|nr:Maf family protein [Paenibacillus sp. 481]UHA74361.1 septum formation inhibitor Maf [Paenibacillus sp. 481]
MVNWQQNSSNLPLIVLASSSPRRQELIRSLQLPYEIQPSDADETVPADWSPVRTVEQLSLRKAEAVAHLRRQSGQAGIVLGSDTVVVLDDHILGKPQDEADACRMLSALQGRTHEVYTGVALIDVMTNRVELAHQKTRVHMRPLTPDQVKRYVATGEPMDKAGSYGIQGVGATIVESIEGCYFNVVGLPLSLLAQMLRSFDVETP